MSSDRISKLLAPLAVALLSALLVPGGAVATPRRALPFTQTQRRNYTAVAVCAAPEPGHAACQSLRVTRRGGASPNLGPVRPAPAKAPSPAEIGYTPEQFRLAYSLPSEPEKPQTIALVDAYNDPTAAADLEKFSEQFGLEPCTKEDGCFTQTNQEGETSSLPFPKTTKELEEALKSGNSKVRHEGEDAAGWGLEISLDIETAHAICQTCKIALVEASGSSFANLAVAEQTAVTTLKANEVSNSWGGAECEAGESSVKCIEPGEAAAPFEHPGTVITASAGDAGYLNWQEGGEPYADYPASLPHVVAVGGTNLAIEAGTAKWLGETAWNDAYGAGGGGCSMQFDAPIWQQAVAGWSGVGCAVKRSVSDVAADADPLSGTVVYYSRASNCFTQYGKLESEIVPNWCQVGGTSLASPLIASMYALAGGAHGISYPAATLYESLRDRPASLHDVTKGSNGECPLGFNEETGQWNCNEAQEAEQCGSTFTCLARVGYDGPTGVGTPDGIEAFVPGEGAGEEGTGEEGTGEEGGKEGGGPPPPKEEPAHVTSTPAAPLPPSGSSGGGATSASTPPVLSDLGLTFKALKALARQRPALTAVGFSFLLSRSAQVRVSLLRRVHRHHHVRWIAVTKPYLIDALGGSNTAHLHGRRTLAHGVYRLLLTPVGGSARSIRFTLD